MTSLELLGHGWFLKILGVIEQNARLAEMVMNDNAFDAVVTKS
jgi:hypothetical protein